MKNSELKNSCIKIEAKRAMTDVHSIKIKELYFKLKEGDDTCTIPRERIQVHLNIPLL